MQLPVPTADPFPLQTRPVNRPLKSRSNVEPGQVPGGSVVAVGSYEFSQNGVVQAAPAIVASARSSAASFSAEAETFTVTSFDGTASQVITVTVNGVNGAEFELTIVPHTLSETIMADYRPGRQVNLEVDLLARYLERLLLGEKAADSKSAGLSESFLAEHGYLKN